MRQRHRFEAEDLARALLVRVCRAIRPPAELGPGDPRSRLRHAAVSASLHLSERGDRRSEESLPYLRRSLEALREVSQHLEACREAGHLDAHIATELMGARDQAAEALSHTLCTLDAATPAPS